VVAFRELAEPDAHLVALLPLAPDDYATDFAGAESLAEFDRLLAAADDVRVMDGAGPREAAYERAGRAVVDGSDVLVALWDGQPSGGRGGTAEIVAYARKRGVPVEVVTVRRPKELT
jgi:hypothetical protein